MAIREKVPYPGDFLLYCLFSDMVRGREPAMSIPLPASSVSNCAEESGEHGKWQHNCNLVERVVVIYVVNHFYKKVRNDCNLGLKAVVKLGQPNKINKPVREADNKIYKS